MALIKSALEQHAKGLAREDESQLGTVKAALRAVREHLDMDVAYISDLSGEAWVLLAVDHAPGAPDLGGVGARLDKDCTFCHHTAIGALPAVLPDTQRDTLAAKLSGDLPFTIGSHISVPLRHPESGEEYGMFCCFSERTDLSLQDRDTAFVEAFAAVSAKALRTELLAKQRADEAIALANSIRRAGGLVPHFQPIYDLRQRAPVAVEALARFKAASMMAPSACFDLLESVAKRTEIELDVIRRAADVALGGTELRVNVNLSPCAVMDVKFAETIAVLPLDKLVLEITEHAPVEDYPALIGKLQPYRELGLQLAVDDVGAGYASLNHVLGLAPDIIKTDRALVNGIDIDPARQALVSSLVEFAQSTDTVLVAEGVETAAELREVERLGVRRVQGYLTGRPAPLQTLAETLAQGSETLEAALSDVNQPLAERPAPVRTQPLEIGMFDETCRASPGVIRA